MLFRGSFGFHRRATSSRSRYGRIWIQPETGSALEHLTARGLGTRLMGAAQTRPSGGFWFQSSREMSAAMSGWEVPLVPGIREV